MKTHEPVSDVQNELVWPLLTTWYVTTLRHLPTRYCGSESRRNWQICFADVLMCATEKYVRTAGLI